MDISTAQFRADLATAFDSHKPFWVKGVAKSAFLYDHGYYIPTLFNLHCRVNAARIEMARILRTNLINLPKIHSGKNGRNDCDNYGFLGSYIVKAQFDAECREKKLNHCEYGIIPMTRADMNHMQALAHTQIWFYIVEFITGKITSIKDDKPEILKLG